MKFFFRVLIKQIKNKDIVHLTLLSHRVKRCGHLWAHVFLPWWSIFLFLDIPTLKLRIIIIIIIITIIVIIIIIIITINIIMPTDQPKLIFPTACTTKNYSPNACLCLVFFNPRSNQNEMWSNTSVSLNKHFKHVFGSRLETGN